MSAGQMLSLHDRRGSQRAMPIRRRPPQRGPASPQQRDQHSSEDDPRECESVCREPEYVSAPRGEYGPPIHD
jgi:hypothetical protein